LRCSINQRLGRGVCSWICLGRTAPQRGEQKAIEILKNYAEELGYYSVVIDSAGNLIAHYGEGNTVIAIIGHIDTIPWELPVSFDGYTIKGRGAVDAKGPLVAAFVGAALARELVDLKKVKVYTIAAVDEEGDSTGAKHLVKSGFRAHGVVIAEPSNTDGVVLGYRGSMRILVKCTSPGGHSSSGTKNSACDKLITLWGKLESLYSGSSDVYSHTPALLKLCCGEDAPVVPRYGEALISIRLAIGSSLENVTKNIGNILSNIDGCTWSLLDYTKPVKVSVNNPAARAMVRAVITNSLKPKILYKYGTSDMNIVYPDVSENVVAYGPGRSELAHTDKEEITVEELSKGIEVYRDFVKEFSHLYRPGS